MAFVDQEDVFAMSERMLARVFKEIKGLDIETPFRRMPYQEAMDRFGSDKPDLRFGLELTDLTDVVAESGFGVFKNTIAGGGVVKAIRLPGGGLSRSRIDKELAGVVKVYGAKGLAWVKFEDGALGGPIAKFFSADEQTAIAGRLGLEEGDQAFFVADSLSVAWHALGALRVHLGKSEGLTTQRCMSSASSPTFRVLSTMRTRPVIAMHHPLRRPARRHPDGY